MDLLNALWVVVCAVIVLDMQAGFLCFESGFVRKKNAASVAIKNICDLCFVSSAFWFVGFGLMYGPSFGGLWGTGPFAPHLANSDDPMTGAFFLFQMAFAATAATIVSGAVAERERFEGYLLLSVTMGAVIYPVAGHWIWGGAWSGGSPGWLAELGFIDFAGATVVHAVGGWAALAAILVLGPRLGRFSHKTRVFEEQSIAMAALGALLLWIGWGAFNGGSALAFNYDVSVIVAHTMMTAAAGGIVSTFLSIWLYRHMRIDLILNGVLAGLVAGTASVHLIDAKGAYIVGAIGALVMLAAFEALEFFKVDDVVGAVPVHLAAGVAGTLCLPWLVPIDALGGLTRWEQFNVQLLGTAAVGLWVMGVSFGVALALNKLGILRASRRNEVRGLNISEHRRYDAFAELLDEMRKHSRSSSFEKRVRVEPSTQAGALALRYNQVLDRVQNEIELRVTAMRQEREMRSMAENAFGAMKAAQEASAWAALHDALTGLGNRKFLEEIAATSVGDNGRAATQLVISIDLDRFKEINDTYGHEAGDQILQSCAARIQNHVREGRDLAFRIGGDEFVLLLEFEDSELHAQWFCDKLLDELVAPVAFRTVQLNIGASIGFALTQDGDSLLEALRRSDLALYEAKAHGRGRVVAFSEKIGTAHDVKLALINDFKDAIKNDQISIELQPQVDAQTLALNGIEVLARWDHPERGRQSPAVFLEIAEELCMLGDLDRRVLDLALVARGKIEAALGFAPDIAVNVSARRLTAPDLLDELASREDLPARGLAFEILETAFLDSVSEELGHTIQSLKDMNISIEVDDFGTGHASFASVLALRPDRLKIDRLFVPGVDHDPDRRELMRGMIEMASRVSAETVIEGIESMEEAKAVAQLGAGTLQGYAISKPLPLDAFIAWAESWQSRAA
ncbi:EAL domain-containing protein [Phaeobacter sp.]|uniref:EAL domain-containing protein n=1 Tax=Phaeobacter sp. TaxID=1902409 RepID=UPI0025CD7187|nr:EAL domain-containing protein [Phaeobacter sp.]